jgi:putative transposase
MKKSRFTESQIVSILKQADAGIAVKDLCRQAGISVATYYQWKSKYGGMEASDLKRVRELETENARLKRLYADLALENAAMKDLIAKKLSGRRRSARRCGIWSMSTALPCVGPAIAWECRARRGTRRRWTGRCATSR